MTQEMKNTLIIILSILLILAGAWILFTPNSRGLEKEQQLIQDKEKLMSEFSKIEEKYKIKEKELAYKEAELFKAKAVVKRSEEKLTQAKAKEKVYLKRIKEQTLLMSEVEAESAIKERFRNDPDSVPQKVVMSLAQLDQCDSVRSRQNLLIEHYAETLQKYDSLHQSFSQMDLYSREQISLLLLSSSKDRQLIDIKTKENKKLRRGKRMAIVAVPVALLVGLFLAK